MSLNSGTNNQNPSANLGPNKLQKLGTQVGNTIAGVFKGAKKGVTTSAQYVGNKGKAAAKGVKDRTNTDRMPKASAVAAMYNNINNRVDTFPAISFSPRGENGALHSFVNPSVSYDLKIVQHFIYEGKTYYIVQQIEKGTHKQGRYTFLDKDGKCVAIKRGPQGQDEELFFVTIEFNGIKDVRVQDSKNALFEEVILDLPAPQQNQQINQNNNVPQKSNAPLVYNRMNPTTRVHIESVRTSFRDAIKQANDIVVIIRNLTPKERKNVDLDSALYMKRFKDILTKGIKSGSVLQKELVAQYIDKKDTYDYHVAFVEDLYNKKDKLKTNSYNERISWSDSIISELKTMFEDLIGEKLN